MQFSSLPKVWLLLVFIFVEACAMQRLAVSGRGGRPSRSAAASFVACHWKKRAGYIQSGRWYSSNVPAVVPTRPLTPCCMSQSRNDFSAGPMIEQRLIALEKEICKLNHGEPINVNSPKQVSKAVFGKIQSTSRSVLSQASSDGNNLPLPQQKIAQLVLQHRELASRIRHGDSKGKNTQVLQAAPFSTMPDFDNEEESSDSAEDTSNDDVVLDDTSPLLDTTSPYGQTVQALFGPKSLMDNYWREPLLCITKPSARAMVSQLNAMICPMGYDPLAVPFDPLRGTQVENSFTPTAGKKGSLLHFVREQKKLYSDCVILMRVGEFYESFGLDAIMLVEHCGLNAMAGKARAGCPIRNVQATLDCLTNQGFRVAVYEEAADTDASAGSGAPGGSKARLKNRMLAQIVSCASPTYLYDLVLQGNADTLVTSPASRPHVGVISVSSGYTLVEVSTEERFVRVSERLTAEAVACRLAAYPPADPLLYIPSQSEYEGASSGIRYLPFLPSRSDSASDGPGSKLRTKILPPSLMQAPTSGVTDVERAQNTIVSALLKTTEQQEGSDDGGEGRRVTIDDFTLVSSSDDSSLGRTHTNPLYVETATQLGLMSDSTIPSLVSCLLPESAPAATRRFLRRWLLTPPPPTAADAMSSLVSFLKDQGPALPPLSVPPVGKVLALLRAGQASAQVYGELLGAMDSTIELLDMFQSDNDVQVGMVEPLMVLLEYESGMKADPQSLKLRCLRASDVIEEVVSPLHHARVTHDENTGMDRISDYAELIPRAFFERNEATWRGRVKANAAQLAYDKVQASALCLTRAVAVDFWGLGPETNVDNLSDLKRKLKERLTTIKNPIVQDVFNNLFAMREVPEWVEDNDGESNYIHPRDRNGKILRNRYTTKRVQDALSDYVTACDEACLEVTAVLTKLSQTLCESGHLPAVVQAAHTNLILSTASHHAAKANSLGWHMAESYESSSDGPAGHFNSVWPYWMDRSEAVSNTFDLNGLFLLTAPNMSGKSTLMRSTAAATLLTNCGLCSPVGAGSAVQRFDSIFVRGASADVPTEQKSAFGAEMEDIAALFRSCGSKSLVFVDELGRGTSPKDGACIAGAVLETMAKEGMSGIFATHLHEVFNLPLTGTERIVNKRMAIHEQSEKDYVWTYRLEDGICTDSMSLVTAKRFGLPMEILDRARDLASYMEGSTTREEYDQDTSTPFSLNGGINSDVTRIAEQVTKQSAHHIRPRWTPPDSLEGRSCLYILEINDAQPSRYYVGETDSLRKRLGQHRSKGGAWSQATTIALPVEGGKTVARNVESLVIQKLAKAGFDLLSISDGRRIRPAPRESQKETGLGP